MLGRIVWLFLAKTLKILQSTELESRDYKNAQLAASPLCDAVADLDDPANRPVPPSHP